MARDYSSRRNSSTNGKKRSNNTRRKPAAKPNKQRAARGGGPPGWVWLLCGLCIGLTVAAGFYIFGRPAGTSASSQQVQIATPEQSKDQGKPAQGDDDGAKQSASADSQDSEPRFSFYKMLPNYEVVIPEEEYPDEKKSASHSSSSHSSSSPVGEPPPPKTQPTTPKVDEPGQYVIQAGSFSTYDDADRRKAELALLGVSAQIVDVDLSSGKTVYRVQSDTISSSDKLNSTLKRLRDNRIDTLVMRAK